MAETMVVEVAYARPERQLIVRVAVSEGATVEEALWASKIQEEFPEIDLGSAPVGVFGKLSERDARLRPGDRVEIYRPLIADPKEIRKQRAALDRRMAKGGKDLSTAQD